MLYFRAKNQPLKDYELRHFSMIFKRHEIVQKLTFMEEPVKVAFLKIVTFEKDGQLILFLLVSFMNMRMHI